MKERRFFYVPHATDSNELPADEASHAVRVLRLNIGDEIFLMDGVGNFYRAEITLTTKSKCLYEIKEKLPQDKTWTGSIHLAIAPTKLTDRIEWMVEKATEIGFDEISFIDCAFSERHVIKDERIDRIIISAMKQSHKGWKPVLNTMGKFSQFIKTPRKGHKYIAHCYDDIEKKDLFTELSTIDKTEDVTILIGPEGDFSKDEVKLAEDNGYQSITLGESRLRTETAGLSAVMTAQLLKRR